MSNPRQSHRIRRAVKAFAPDVVVSFIEQTNIRVLAGLLGAGFSVIVSERTDARAHRVGRRWELARRALYPVASAVVVQADMVAAWASRLVHKGKVRVIPNFVRLLHRPPGFRTRANLILGGGRLGSEGDSMC